MSHLTLVVSQHADAVDLGADLGPDGGDAPVRGFVVMTEGPRLPSLREDLALVRAQFASLLRLPRRRTPRAVAPAAPIAPVLHLVAALPAAELDARVG